MNDLDRASRFFRRFPEISRRALQTGVRKSVQPFKKRLKNATLSAGWPIRFRYVNKGKSQNLNTTIIRTVKRMPRGSYGVSIIAKYMGPATLMEYGTTGLRKPKKRGKRLKFRDTRTGKWVFPKAVAPMPPKPAWGKAIYQFQNSGIKEAEDIIWKEFLRVMDKTADKEGLRRI